MKMDRIDTPITANAVSVYGEANAMDDFPVLRAFQQYIDAEHAKARKRILMISVFFGILMVVVIGIFVVMLVISSARNQLLNDRLVEYAMSDRNRPVRSPDPTAVLTLTDKIETLQKKLLESQENAMKATMDAEMRIQKIKTETLQANGPSAEEREIARLKALLADETKKRTDMEKEQKRKDELEAYRRKHYPELYVQPSPKKETQQGKPQKDIPRTKATKSADREIEDLMKLIDDDDDAIRYFDEDERREKKYSIPVDVRGSSKKESTTWRIPADD